MKGRGNLRNLPAFRFAIVNISITNMDGVYYLLGILFLPA